MTPGFPPPMIIALWAVPRSTSTAFEKVMRQRGDLRCFHEPFGEVWHCGDDDRCPPAHRYQHRPGLTLASRWAELQDAAADGLVFIKDFAHHVEPLTTSSGERPGDFLPDFRHSFLIRHPAKALVSLHRRWPDFTLQEAGFESQRALFDRLSDLSGSPPPIIDSDDLLDRPEATMAAWCEAVGLPDRPDALHWEPGTPLETDWYDGTAWHQTLDDSTGLRSTPSSARTEASASRPDIGDLPELAEAYEACLPHYEHLYRHRISSA